jgi:hypothetical protein
MGPLLNNIKGNHSPIDEYSDIPMKKVGVQ